jgi:hypothetical protein
MAASTAAPNHGPNHRSAQHSARLRPDNGPLPFLRGQFSKVMMKIWEGK